MVERLLFKDHAGDGTSDVIKWNGGPGIVFYSGNFDGAVCSIETAKDAGSEWTQQPSSVSSDPGSKVFISPGPCLIRGTISNAGGGTLITMQL